MSELENRIKETLARKKTACQCTGPGYCSRHCMFKTDRNFGMCCINENYFDLWERCMGPGQPQNCEEYKNLSEAEAIAKLELQAAVDKPSEGLGDTVAKIAHATGLDKVAKKAGCTGCNKRRKWLNNAIPFKNKK